MISIALATYNGSRYLQDQLDSFLNQTRPPDELVVCDDCSSDDTFEILQRFKAKANFDVIIERNASNIGSVANFAKAISLCSGRYIFYSDQDDVWYEKKIEIMMESFESNRNIGLVFCNAEAVDDKLNPLGFTYWDGVFFYKKGIRKVRKNHAFDVFLNHAVVAGMAAAFRSDLRSIILPIPEIPDGYDGWTALLASAVSKIAVIDQILVKYRLHDENLNGIRVMNLREQFSIGRKQVRDDTFPNLLFLKKSLLNRLMDADIREKHQIDGHILRSLQSNIDHLSRRISLSDSIFLRIVPVLTEIMRRNYFKYSYGMKSIAQDLFLR